MVEGHVVFELEGRSVLLDTGSPSTYSRSGSVTLGGCPLPAQPMPDEIARLLDDHVNARIDAILGMDALSHRRIAIESSVKRLVLEGPGQTAGRLDGVIAIPLRLALGLPVVEIEAHRRYPVVFDTGAPLSYLKGPRVRPLGTRSDFYLGIGAFETRVDTVAVAIAGRTVHLSSGEPPPELAQLLNGNGSFEGILGSELLEMADVALDTVAGAFLVRWHEGVP